MLRTQNMEKADFKKEYTTSDKKKTDPVKEANKLEISNDAYAIGQYIEKLINKLEQIRTQ